ncbi:Pkinase-domain-containing protein [Basidiobolus meristosporus CBS 931.73]|uniref:Pkinase-domain-containing protein n=1 Tax=Basidiobolus meristosporus CBS 931.73 TaxID=1314790 RepID=A0A1Y1XYQ0_9FUNG|nr:Pkinase-domain-containing protein [Basidiobolus meristosporus CBS 931.73]|eukprot:ORX90871.1 Pkinase-domain-containing protein [Basidiobolus meristosporus CBS 931.73]
MDSQRRSTHRYNRSRSPPRSHSKQRSNRHDREVGSDLTNSPRKRERDGSSYHSTRSSSRYSPERKHRPRSRSRHSRDDQSRRRQQTSRSDHYSPPKDKYNERSGDRRRSEPRQRGNERDSHDKKGDDSKENLDKESSQNSTARKNRDRKKESKDKPVPTRSTERTAKRASISPKEYTRKSTREYSSRSSKTTTTETSEKREKYDCKEQTESSRNRKKRGSPPASNRSPSKRAKLSDKIEGSGLASGGTASNDKSKSDKSERSTKEDIYERLEQVGEGTYGKVFKARNITSNTVVALKRIKVDSEKDGFPLTALREIKLLQSLSHQNIIQLPEISFHKGSLYMVFEYMDYDLTGFLAHPGLTLSTAHIKRIMVQILRGIKYLHQNGVLHRDLKASNLLLNKRGQLKLADFGLARIFEKCKNNQYTNRVITLWYRPPELLLGGTKYGPEVDMWSVGCIMMELFLRKPLFQGKDEISQLQLIYDLLGTPTPESWPTISKLPWYALVKPKEVKKRRFEADFQDLLSPEAFSLVSSLLSMNPTERPSAEQALQHKYFTSEKPGPCEYKDFPKLEGDWHEFEAKEMRKKNQKQNLDDLAPRPSHVSKTSQDSSEQRHKHPYKEHTLHSRSPKSAAHQRLAYSRKQAT